MRIEEMYLMRLSAPSFRSLVSWKYYLTLHPCLFSSSFPLTFNNTFVDRLNGRFGAELVKEIVHG